MSWVLEGRERVTRNGKFTDSPVMNVTLEEYKKMGQRKKKINLILLPFCSWWKEGANSEIKSMITPFLVLCKSFIGISYGFLFWQNCYFVYFMCILWPENLIHNTFWRDCWASKMFHGGHFNLHLIIIDTGELLFSCSRSTIWIISNCWSRVSF